MNISHKLHQRKNLVDEFNKSISYIQCSIPEIVKFHDILASKSDENISSNKIKESLNRIKILLNNSYFHFMYINNFAIKDFLLKLIQMIVQNLNINNEQELKFELESFKILDKLVEYDYDLNNNEFRNEATKLIYEEYFCEILPHLRKSLNVSKIEYSNDTNGNPIHSNSIFVPETKPDEKLFVLNKLLCYAFSCVTLEYLVKIEFLPKALDLIFNQLLSPLLYAQLMYTISINLCNLDHDKQDLTKVSTIDEQFKLEIHDKCSQQTLILMEKNVRVEESRNLLKKALNNYCHYIITHKKYLESSIQSNTVEIQKNDILNTEKLNDINQWQESLYKIVISIVKILRMEFENNTTFVEIDLVIYFYELLLSNIDSLTDDDATNIANKLMPVLIKINDWRKREINNEMKKITIQQSQYLRHLSFKLTDKFMKVLKSEFTRTHWNKFEPIWLEALKEWYPMGFEIISTFCRYSQSFESFEYIQIIANQILTSWKINYEQHNIGYPLGIEMKKKYNTFLTEECVNAVTNLIHFYDFMIQNDTKHFNDFVLNLIPILEVIQNLFSIIDVKKQFIMLNQFYSNLFCLKSPLLKQVSIWKNHIILIFSSIDKLSQRNVYFDFDIDTLDSTFNLLKALTLFFGSEYISKYQTVIIDFLNSIPSNFNINSLEYNEFFEAYKY